MIEINTTKGEKYSYDEETQRVFKDGTLLSSTSVEPIFSNLSGVPSFAGLLLKDKNSILTLSGTYNPITDINTIS